MQVIGICIWDKVFKNGPSKIFGRQPLNNFTWSILEYFVPFVKRSSKLNLKRIPKVYCLRKFFQAKCFSEDVSKILLFYFIK